MIVFSNAGEIDIRSITSFGVSVKESGNPIGYFGTGLKYAIAVLLRCGQQVMITSGKDLFVFSKKSEAVRGVTFDFVAVSKNGSSPESIGFTTELGKNWELWMAYRELVCNCKDENGQHSYEKEAPDPESGKTKVIVCGQDFEQVYSVGQFYVLDEMPSFIENGLEILKRGGDAFYYRGVRVYQFDKPGFYTYNAITKMDLTEDRTLKEPAYAKYNIAKSILQSTNKQLIRDCVLAGSAYMENSLDFHGWNIKPSKEFIEVVGGCVTDKLFDCNQTARKVWEETEEKSFEPQSQPLTTVQSKSMDKAILFCKQLGFNIDQYPVKVVESLGSGGLGLAKNNTIYIADRVFTLGGTKQLASTLIEEYLHLKHGYKDMTRELQSYLFDKVVSLGEELQGEPL